MPENPDVVERQRAALKRERSFAEARHRGGAVTEIDKSLAALSRSAKTQDKPDKEEAAEPAPVAPQRTTQEQAPRRTARKG